MFMNYEGINTLLDTLAVYNIGDDLPESEITAAWKALLMAKNELTEYLTNYLGDEPVQCCVIYPAGNIEIIKLLDDKEFNLDFIYLPFGCFSANLWNALREDKDNWLFKVLTYMSWYAVGVTFCFAEGFEVYEVITKKMVEEHAVWDIFSLRSYYNVYKDVDTYIS